MQDVNHGNIHTVIRTNFYQVPNPHLRCIPHPEADKHTHRSRKSLKEEVSISKQADTENIPPPKITECPSCKKQIRDEDALLHLKSCTVLKPRINKKPTQKSRSKLEEPKQKENIPEIETVEQTLKLVCHRCNKGFTSEEMTMHSKECYPHETGEEKNLPITAEISKKPLKEIINKSMPVAKTEKAPSVESKECMYCKTLCEPDIYEAHILNCQEKPTELTQLTHSKADFSTQTPVKSPKHKPISKKEPIEMKPPEIVKLQKKPSLDKSLKQDQLQRSIRLSLPTAPTEPEGEADKLTSERKKKPEKTLDLMPKELVSKVKTAFMKTTKSPIDDEKAKQIALSQSMIVPRLQFCHMCGLKYIPKAQFCAYCGVKKHS